MSRSSGPASPASFENTLDSAAASDMLPILQPPELATMSPRSLDRLQRLQNYLAKKGMTQQDIAAFASFCEQRGAKPNRLHVNQLELNNPVELMKVKDLVDVGNYMHLNKDTAKYLLASRILCYQNQRHLMRDICSEQGSRPSSLRSKAAGKA